MLQPPFDVVLGLCDMVAEADHYVPDPAISNIEINQQSFWVHNKFFLKVLNRSSCDSSIGQIGCYREPF